VIKSALNGGLILEPVSRGESVGILDGWAGVVLLMVKLLNDILELPNITCR